MGIFAVKLLCGLAIFLSQINHTQSESVPPNLSSSSSSFFPSIRSALHQEDFPCPLLLPFRFSFTGINFHESLILLKSIWQLLFGGLELIFEGMFFMTKKLEFPKKMATNRGLSRQLGLCGSLSSHELSKDTL